MYQKIQISYVAPFESVVLLVRWALRTLLLHEVKSHKQTATFQLLAMKRTRRSNESATKIYHNKYGLTQTTLLKEIIETVDTFDSFFILTIAGSVLNNKWCKLYRMYIARTFVHSSKSMWIPLLHIKGTMSEREREERWIQQFRPRPSLCSAIITNDFTARLTITKLHKWSNESDRIDFSIKLHSNRNVSIFVRLLPNGNNTKASMHVLKLNAN